MVTNKRKKNVKFRASRSHGYGSHKKHRGAGHRGGRGRAGTGKRGDAKKPRFWKDPKYFGKYGFGLKSKEVKTVNIKYLEDRLEQFVNKNLVAEKAGVYEVDAAKLGFDKILGYGKVTKKFKITANAFSKDAAEKIKAAGGEAIIIKPKVKENKRVEKKLKGEVSKIKVKEEKEQPSVEAEVPKKEV
ncbi:uL15 family ribosomal protein [Candidatus Woesearchaeota archaeon]|nr:uL15 family ribosomal protein [Candidatus Woesearchaeota archaeon]